MKDSFKNLIEKSQNNFYFWRAKCAERKQYGHMLSVNHLSNKKAEGEDAWMKRWAFGRYKPSAECYRLYANYLKYGGVENIVSDIICSKVIEPTLNPLSMRSYYEDKNMFDIICPRGYFPKTYLRRMNGFYYDADYNRLVTKDACRQAMREAEGKGVVVKPTVGGMSGRGVKVFAAGDSLSLAQIEKEEGDDFIIQERISQHKETSKFNPSSVNTLRLALYRSVVDDSVHVLNAVIRIGGEGAQVDNAHQGGRFVAITPEGKLGEKAFNQYGESVSKFHNIDFTENHKIPSWGRISDFAKSVCQYVPHHRLLALDCVLREDSTPCLLEFNVEGFSMWLFQLTGYDAFEPFTEEILKYCRKKFDRKQ